MLRSSLRWLLLLAPALGPLVFGGCSSNTVTRTTRQQRELFGETPQNDCRLFVLPVGEPRSFTLAADVATSICSCEYQTDSADYPGGCGYHHCESSYDLGADNPDVCSDAGTEPLGLTGADVAVDDPACSATAQVDPASASQVIITVLCRSAVATALQVRVESESGSTVTLRSIRATPDGACPPPNPDGATQDGGDAGDAG